MRELKTEDFITAKLGLPTIKDILSELERPGRDPRPEFKAATFKEGVETLKDLTEGMVLEGVVTNVANFGAFIDIGVHQDGLVHISALANTFVKDPRTIVKAGDIVKVKVIEIDINRKRIALSMRLDDETGAAKKAEGSAHPAKRSAEKYNNRSKPKAEAIATGTMASLMKAAMEKNK